MSQALRTEAADPGKTADQMQVVTLGLGEETVALDAGLVREIIDPVPITSVPGARPFLPGIINVRGNVIPLADLHARFGMAKPQTTPDTRIVVLEVDIDGDPVLVGVVADKVHEVTELSHAAVQQTPRVGMHWRPEFVRFIAKWNEAFVIVPNMQRILN
jgi:purine-binding chemotaxis protein CheW